MTKESGDSRVGDQYFEFVNLSISSCQVSLQLLDLVIISLQVMKDL
jgi:hypothetical protein